MKVKTILVSEPKVENSPYFELQQKHKVKIDFRPFIHVGVNAKRSDFKIDLNNYTIILTSRNSVDHFLELPMKCVSRYLKV
jgi:uroporphyrinogen-III synthase